MGAGRRRAYRLQSRPRLFCRHDVRHRHHADGHRRGSRRPVGPRRRRAGRLAVGRAGRHCARPCRPDHAHRARPHQPAALRHGGHTSWPRITSPSSATPSGRSRRTTPWSASTRARTASSRRSAGCRPARSRRAAGVWVLGIDGTIARIDRRTNRIAVRGRIGASAVASLTVGGGAAWVSAPGDGTVWRIDPGPRLVMRTIDVGAGAGDLSFGAGSVWVANPLRGTLAQIDPATNRVRRTLQLGGAPRAVAAAADGVWVTVAGDRRSAAADADGRAAGAPVHSSCEPTFFGGGGRPDRLIVSDLPLQGGVRISAQQMAQAAAFVLRRRGFRAGELRVGLQSCDDSIARSGLFEPAKCAANARAYARDERVVAVMGTLNSPCTAAALPELARAPGGPLAMLSPLNSSVSLTRPQAGAPPGELRSLYPGGRRHFARVFPTDDHQAVALASLAVERPRRATSGRARRRRPAVRPRAGRPLCDRCAIARRARLSRGAAGTPRRAATTGWPAPSHAPGPTPSSSAASWTPTAPRCCARCAALSGRRWRSWPARASRGTALLAKQAGAAAEGTYVSVSGLINASLPRRRPALRRCLRRHAPRGRHRAERRLRSRGDRSAARRARGLGRHARGVLRALFRTDLRGGLTGRIRFDRNGDVIAAPITILQIRRGSRRLPVDPDAEVARVVR